MTTETVHIEALTPKTDPLWEEYVRKHPEGGFYHRLWWRDLFRSTFRYESHHLIAKRRGEIVGAMPLFKTPMMKGSLMSSIPFRDRAAPLADDGLVLEKLLCEAMRLAEEKGCKTLLIKSVSPLPLKGDLADTFSRSSDWVRSLVKLPSSRDGYWKKINDKTRNMIRQADNAGLKFSHMARDAGAVGEAVSILRETQHRLGIPPFPKSYYRDLAATLAQEGSGEVCTVHHDGRVVAAAILFFEEDTATYAYTGSLPETWPLRVNDFLVWNAVGAAIDRGKTFFDFGSDSAKQENLLFFKKKWGAERLPLHYYSHTVGGEKGHPYVWRDSSQGLYPLLRHVVRRMPAPVYELTGLLTRYFA